MKIIDYITNLFSPKHPDTDSNQKTFDTLRHYRGAKTARIEDFAGAYATISSKKIHSVLFGQSIADRYKLWEYINMQDAIVHSSMQQRCLALAGKEWDIVTEQGIDNNIMHNITQVIKDMNIATLIEHMLRDHVGCGVCVLRIEWGTLYNMRMPVKIEIIDGSALDRRNRHTLKSEVCYVSDNDETIFINDYPLSIIDTSTSDIDLGVLPLCAWNYMLKRYAMRDWQVAAERTGVPPTVFVLPDMPSPEMITTVTNASRNMAQGITGVVPFGTQLLSSNVSRSDYTTLYKSMIDSANTEIITGILGQTASTQGTVGTLGNESLRAEVKQNLLDADARFIEGVMDRILSFIWFANYGSYLGAPQFRISTTNGRDTTALSTTLQTLVNIGLPVSTSWVYETFDIPQPANNEPVLSSPVAATTAPTGFMSMHDDAIHNKKSMRKSAEVIESEYYTSWRRAFPDAPEETLKTFSKLEGVTRSYGSQIADSVEMMLQSFDWSNPNTSLDIEQVKDNINGIIQDGLANSYLIGAQRFRREASSKIKRYKKSEEVEVTSDIYLELHNAIEGVPQDISEVYALADDQFRELMLSVTDKIAQGVADAAQQTYFNVINDAILSGINKVDFAQFISNVVTVTEAHANTIFRTAGATVLQHARAESEKIVGDMIWGYEYIAVMDGRTRPEHAAFDQFKAQKEHPFWQKGLPPNGYNCRCDYSTIFSFEADKVTNSMYAEIPEGGRIDDGFSGDPMDTLIAHIQNR